MSAEDRPTTGSGLAEGTRVRVMAGRPTPAEVAALVAALHHDGARPRPAPAAAPPSRWAQAGRLEHVTGTRIVTAAHVRRTGQWAR